MKVSKQQLSSFIRSSSRDEKGKSLLKEGESWKDFEVRFILSSWANNEPLVKALEEYIKRAEPTCPVKLIK